MYNILHHFENTDNLCKSPVFGHYGYINDIYMCQVFVTMVFQVIMFQSLLIKTNNLSLVVRKPAFCICENKDADQLRSNCAADQRLCFRYTINSTMPLLPKSEISSLKPSSVAVQPGLCQARSETPKTGFLTTRLIRKPGFEAFNRVGPKHGP